MSIIKQRPPGQQFSPFHPHTLVPLTCSSSVMVLTGLACSLSSGQRGRLSLRTGRGSVLGAGGLKGSVSLALKEGRRPLLLPTRSLSGPISGQGNGRSHHPQQSLTCWLCLAQAMGVKGLRSVAHTLILFLRAPGSCARPLYRGLQWSQSNFVLSYGVGCHPPQTRRLA